MKFRGLKLYNFLKPYIPKKVKKEINFTRRPETLSIDEFAKLL